MKTLLLQSGSLHRSASLGIACVVGALVASCATGSPIADEEVIFIPSARPGTEDIDAPEAAGDEVESSAGEGGGDEALQPVSGGTSEDGADEDLPRGEQLGDDEPSSEPADEEPTDDDSAEPLPPVDVPIVDTERPDDDDADEPNPGPGSGPIIEPDPVADPPRDGAGDPPVSDPVVPPPATDPDIPTLPPLQPDPSLPAAGHCLAGWEGSSCDVCSGQTQSDRLACRLYIDCYIINDCDPLTCGSVEQACGVNRIGNGLAPKDIADSVYSCMCAP